MSKGKKKILSKICVLWMLVCGSILVGEYINGNKEPDEYKPTPSEVSYNEADSEDVTVNQFRVKLAPDVDLNAERRKHNNNDIMGRLEIPGLFNVLVVRSNNNSFYLDRSVDKKYDVRGTEFLDYRVTPTSKQVNIYGHNSRDTNVKVPFLKLEKYLDKSFFDSNPYIIFQHDEGKSLYEIRSIKEISETNNEHMYVSYTGKDFVAHVNAMTNSPVNSRYVPIEEDSDILVLQTCSHHWANALYIIVAVKVDYEF